MTKLSSKIRRDAPYHDTEVSYEKTKTQIEKLLKSYGVKGIRWTSLEGKEDLLEFIVEAEIRGVKKQLGISVSPPRMFIKKRKMGYGIVTTRNTNQEYRLLFYWIKAKIEAVIWGLSTIEREFLNEITMKLADGTETTIGKVVMDLVGENRLNSLPFFGSKNPPGSKPVIIELNPEN